jgi:hypothetical protein
MPMYKTVPLLAAALGLFALSPARAAEKKTPTFLYVKARNTRLMASAAPTANVVTILQPGQAVEWLGSDPKARQWHHVKVSGKQGVVFQSNLSKQPPSMELVAQDGGKKEVNAGVFASSGAAVKGLSDGAIKYGQGKKDPSMDEAVKQLQALEEHVDPITPEELAAHAAKARLFPVVGPRELATRGGK